MRRDAGRVATRAGAHPAGHCALAIGIGMPGSAWAGARADHFPAAGIPHRRPRSFWCRSSFLVPGFEGPWHHSRKSSQLYSSRCMHTQTPPAYVLAQPGWALALRALYMWAVNCNAHAPMARPVRRHGRACPPRRAASRRELAALGSGGQNAAAMGRRRSGCNSFYHKEQLRCHPSKPTSCHTLPAPCHTMRHPP